MEKQPIKLFIDLDGVLVDFNKGVIAACGQSPELMQERVMWPILAKTPGFYAKLGWMPDGKVLWDFVKSYKPYILTGLPLGKWAEPQKRLWCRNELGPDVPVITCMSRHKGRAAMEFLEPGDLAVLVDDRLKSREGWDGIGGRFIFHTRAEQSIEELKGLL